MISLLNIIRMLYNYCLTAILALIVTTHAIYTNSDALDLLRKKALTFLMATASEGGRKKQCIPKI